LVVIATEGHQELRKFVPIIFQNDLTKANWKCT